MKKIIAAASAAVLSVAAFASGAPCMIHAENPIVQTSFTPDPAPVVFGDELYVFTGCDRDGDNDFYKMTGWQCFSTKDMKNWTDHGRILEDTSFSWCGENDAWASQCIERNGKYYFYFTTTNNTGGGRAIGVAVADDPAGPYEDVLGKPLCGPNWNYIDPTVMIDDDGQAWLMFGNPTCYYVKLKEDMVTLDGPIQSFDMTEQAFGPHTPQNADDKKTCAYGEGPWICKHDDLYYLVYAAFVGRDTGESMAYATAPSVTGPWTYRGQIQTGSNCYTIHGGIIDYKDHSYYFYHMSGIPGGGVFNRSAACEEFTFNSDGSIPSLPSTKSGPEQIELLDPFVRVEAETICWSEGIKTEKCSEGGVNIANIENGDYIKVSGVDFNLGADTFTASVASAGSGGKIELHIDSLSGDIIGTLDVPVTDGWQNWTEVSCPVVVSGEHDLYLKFTGGSSYLFNVDWWKFSGPGSSGSSSDDGYLFHSTYETGTNSWSGRGSAKVAASTDASYAGSKSLRVTGREASWNGAVRTLGSKFKAGQSYSFSADVMYDSGETSQKFYLTLQYKDSEGEVCYDKVATGTAVSGEWLQLANTSYTLPEGASDFYLYVETAEGECDFYIDEAIGAEDGTVIEGPGGGIVFTLGDIDDNGVINALDIALARQVLAGSLTDSAAKLAADVNNDGEVKANDVVLIQRFVLGEITSFNVVEVMT